MPKVRYYYTRHGDNDDGIHNDDDDDGAGDDDKDDGNEYDVII